jgi:tetratricopeptide (TPR) repeat protein
VSKGYSAKDVARLLDLSVGQVRSFARAGFLEPSRGLRGEYRFSFQDLVLLRTAKGLRAARIPPRRLRAALLRLRQQLPTGEPLSGVQIVARGDRILVRRGGAMIDPESGQSAFDFDVAELVEKVAPHARRTVDEARRSGQPPDAEGWYEIGFELEAVAPRESRRAYEHALELEPGHVDARINLGRLLLLAGEIARSEEQFRLAAAYEPQNAIAWFNLGVVLEDLARPIDARAAYRQAVTADPRFADAYFNLSRLLEQAGDSRAALRALKTYRKLTSPES